jgi:hypothetical protein
MAVFQRALSKFVWKVLDSMRYEMRWTVFELYLDGKFLWFMEQGLNFLDDCQPSGKVELFCLALFDSRSATKAIVIYFDV